MSGGESASSLNSPSVSGKNIVPTPKGHPRGVRGATVVATDKSVNRREVELQKQKRRRSSGGRGSYFARFNSISAHSLLVESPSGKRISSGPDLVDGKSPGQRPYFLDKHIQVTLDGAPLRFFRRESLTSPMKSPVLEQKGASRLVNGTKNLADALAVMLERDSVVSFKGELTKDMDRHPSKREVSQLQVMRNIRPSCLAKAYFDSSAHVDDWSWEYAHIVSYWILGAKAQHADNLFLGTSTVNSNQLLPEDLMRQFRDNFGKVDYEIVVHYAQTKADELTAVAKQVDYHLSLSLGLDGKGIEQFIELDISIDCNVDRRASMGMLNAIAKEVYLRAIKKGHEWARPHFLRCSEKVQELRKKTDCLEAERVSRAVSMKDDSVSAASARTPSRPSSSRAKSLFGGKDTPVAVTGLVSGGGEGGGPAVPTSATPLLRPVVSRVRRKGGAGQIASSAPTFTPGENKSLSRVVKRGRQAQAQTPLADVSNGGLGVSAPSGPFVS